ncbi:serine hydrolase, partial [Roseateles chitinivorans]
ADSWSTGRLTRVAPTALDEDPPGINPHFGLPLRGTVHDPTARRMGGVAGSAGVFTTVHDLGLFAQALLDRRANRPSTFPLQQAPVALIRTPPPPGAGPDLRGLAWDIATQPSPPPAPDFPVGSSRHTVFTWLSMLIDPGSHHYPHVLAPRLEAHRCGK